MPAENPSPERSSTSAPGVSRSAADGAFEFAVRAGQPDVTLNVAAAGLQRVTITPDGDPILATSWPSPFVVRLERPSLAIRGRVLDAAGHPCPDAWVDLLDTT